MDIKTRAIHTPFLEKALEKNCHIIYGYEMFTEQALGQFDLWFPEQSQQKDKRSTFKQEVKKAVITYQH
jgi:3-dehydroquinate dehydratase/shikimate dehydrogenase